MLIIESLTDDPNQRHAFALPDGSQITMELSYSALQYGWFIRRLEYEDFVVRGLRISNSPNFLHQFRNLIPFGLTCQTNGGREPTQLQDFSSGAAKLYILTEEEVEQFAEFLRG